MVTRNVLIKVNTLGAGKLSSLGSSIGNINTNATRATRTLGGLSLVANAVITAIAIRRLGEYADRWNNVNNKLRQVTTSQTHLNSKTQEMYDIAQGGRAALESVATLYFRISQAAEGMGASEEQAAAITESLTNQLTAAGLTAGEVNSVLIQTSQAFNKGYLNGDEFRSISEAMPSILKDVAKELTAVSGGLTIGKDQVKKYGEEGKITSAIMANAFINSLTRSRQVLADSTVTMGQSMQIISNAMTLAIGKFDEYYNISGVVADGSIAIKDSLEELGAILSSGALHEYLSAHTSRWSNPIDELCLAVEQLAVTVEKNFPGIGKTIDDAFSNLIPKMTTFIKLMTIELTTDYGAAIADGLEHFLTTLDPAAAVDKWHASQKKVNEVRKGMISQLVDEHNQELVIIDEKEKALDKEIDKIREKRDALAAARAASLTSDSASGGVANVKNPKPKAGGLTDTQQQQLESLYAYGKAYRKQLGDRYKLAIRFKDMEKEYDETAYGEKELQIAMQLETELMQAQNRHAMVIERIGKENAEKLDLETTLQSELQRIKQSAEDAMGDASKQRYKDEIKGALGAFSMMASLNKKSQGLAKLKIVADTAVGAMNAYATAPNFYLGVVQAALVVAAGLKNLSQVGKSSMSGGGGGAGAVAEPNSPGITSSSLSSERYMTTDSSLATETLNELRRMDPNGMLSVNMVRGLVASVVQAKEDGLTE